MDGNDGDAYGRTPHWALSPDQFRDFIGPTGSFGDPLAAGTWVGTPTVGSAAAW